MAERGAAAVGAAAEGTGPTGALPTALTGASDRATGLVDAADAAGVAGAAEDAEAAYATLAQAEAYLGTHPKRWITLLGWALTR